MERDLSTAIRRAPGGGREEDDTEGGVHEIQGRAVGGDILYPSISAFSDSSDEEDTPTAKERVLSRFKKAGKAVSKLRRTASTKNLAEEAGPEPRLKSKRSFLNIRRPKEDIPPVPPLPSLLTPKSSMASPRPPQGSAEASTPAFQLRMQKRLQSESLFDPQRKIDRVQAASETSTSPNTMRSESPVPPQSAQSASHPLTPSPASKARPQDATTREHAPSGYKLTPPSHPFDQYNNSSMRKNRPPSDPFMTPSSGVWRARQYATPPHPTTMRSVTEPTLARSQATIDEDTTSLSNSPRRADKPSHSHNPSNGSSFGGDMASTEDDAHRSTTENDVEATHNSQTSSFIKAHASLKIENNDVATEDEMPQAEKHHGEQHSFTQEASPEHMFTQEFSEQHSSAEASPHQYSFTEQSPEQSFQSTTQQSSQSSTQQSFQSSHTDVDPTYMDSVLRVTSAERAQLSSDVKESDSPTSTIVLEDDWKSVRQAESEHDSERRQLHHRRTLEALTRDPSPVTERVTTFHSFSDATISDAESPARPDSTTLPLRLQPVNTAEIDRVVLLWRDAQPSSPEQVQENDRLSSDEYMRSFRFPLPSRDASPYEQRRLPSPTLPPANAGGVGVAYTTSRRQEAFHMLTGEPPEAEDSPTLRPLHSARSVTAPVMQKSEKGRPTVPPPLRPLQSQSPTPKAVTTPTEVETKVAHKNARAQEATQKSIRPSILPDSPTLPPTNNPLSKKPVPQPQRPRPDSQALPMSSYHRPFRLVAERQSPQLDNPTTASPQPLLQSSVLYSQSSVHKQSASDSPILPVADRDRLPESVSHKQKSNQKPSLPHSPIVPSTNYHRLPGSASHKQKQGQDQPFPHNPVLPVADRHRLLESVPHKQELIQRPSQTTPTDHRPDFAPRSHNLGHGQLVSNAPTPPTPNYSHPSNYVPYVPRPARIIGTSSPSRSDGKSSYRQSELLGAMEMLSHEEPDLPFPGPRPSDVRPTKTPKPKFSIRNFSFRRSGDRGKERAPTDDEVKSPITSSALENLPPLPAPPAPSELNFEHFGVRPPPMIVQGSGHYRHKYGLEDLHPRDPDSGRHHPNHIFTWDTRKLACADHEGICSSCRAECCVLQQGLRDLRRTSPPLDPFCYKAVSDMVEDLQAQAPKVFDVFPRMLRCSACRRMVCPDCAGRCENGKCTQVTCRDCCEGGDPWKACHCFVKPDRIITPDNMEKIRRDLKKKQLLQQQEKGH